MYTIRAPTHEVVEAVHSGLQEKTDGIVYRAIAQSLKVCYKLCQVVVVVLILEAFCLPSCTCMCERQKNK